MRQMAKPPSYPREEHKSPRTEGELLSYHHSEQNSFTSQRSKDPSMLSYREHEELMKRKDSSYQQEMERQRILMLEEFNMKMQSYEESLRREFQQRIEYLEQRAAEKEECERALLDLKGQLTGKSLSEEMIRRQYEDQLTELSDQRAVQEKEIARLQHLLKLANETADSKSRDLQMEVEHLSQDVVSSEAQIKQLREVADSQRTEIAALNGKLQSRQKVEADYAAVAKELTEEKLRNKRDGELKHRLQALEQEHQLLKRDYDTLAGMHKRALKDLKKVTAEDHKLPENVAEPRKALEAKCAELKEEAALWKEKTRKLVSRYYHALEKMQRDNKQLKLDLAQLTSDTQQSLRDINLVVSKGTSQRPPKAKK